MRIAFAAAIAGRRHVHQPRVLAVLHVAHQDAVLDQHGAVGGRAFVIDRERAAALRHGAVVHHGDALGGDALAHEAGEGRGLLAVEVAFEPMPDRFVQHHARPTGAEHHIHFAGWRRDRGQVGERLAHRLLNGILPALGRDEAPEALTPAVAIAAGFLPVTLADDHRDVDPHQRPHVAVALAVPAQDFDHLPGGAERDRDLPHPRILGPRIGVDRLQEPHLALERGLLERIVVAIEPGIGAPGRLGVAARIAALDRAHCVRRARDRGRRQVGGMGVADRLVLDGTHAEALRGVVGRLLEPPVVEMQHLGLAIFEKQLAVIGTLEAAGELPAGFIAVQSGAVEQRHGGHDGPQGLLSAQDSHSHPALRAGQR